MVILDLFTTHIILSKVETLVTVSYLFSFRFICVICLLYLSLLYFNLNIR